MAKIQSFCNFAAMKERKVKILFGLIAIMSCFLLYEMFLAAQNVGEHPDKIWLHRCNSLEKLDEMSEDYENIEVDVVYRAKSNTLDVTHDLDTTFHLKIDKYFEHFEDEEGRMWLDIKNLSAANKDSILQELNDLCSQYDIDKSRLIIESPSWRELRSFTENGYYTSMYITFDKPNSMSKEEKVNCMHELKKIIKTGAVEAISFPYWWYSDIKENVNNSIDLLTWKHRSSEFLVHLSRQGKKMLEDSQLKVVLVKDKGEHHR